MNGGPIWYELMSPDPGAIAPFFRATLGWKIPDEAMSDPNGSEYRIIQRADGGHAGGVLRLSSEMISGGARPGWLPYFYVDDVDAAVAKVQEFGGKVWMSPSTMEDVGRMALVSDPQGAPFYLMRPIPPENDPNKESDVFDPMKAGHCRWNELNTNDAAGAWRFYKALFGWEMGAAMPMGELGQYEFIDVGGLIIGAVNPAIPENTGPHWLPVFGVFDIDSTKRAVQENGGTITHDLQEIPGGEFALNAEDPSGAALGFIGPRGV